MIHDYLEMTAAPRPSTVSYPPTHHLPASATTDTFNRAGPLTTSVMNSTNMRVWRCNSISATLGKSSYAPF